MATTVYSLPNGKVAGNKLAAAEVNLLGNEAEAVYTQLAELIGAGCFAAGDFNLTILPGQLAVQVSAGTAIVGGADAKKLVQNTGAVNATGLTASNTNYIYLQRDGTFTSNITGVAPANTLLVATAATNGSEATSVDNAPAARVNIGSLLTALAELNDLADVDTSGVADGEALVYNDGTSTWEVGAPAPAAHAASHATAGSDPIAAADIGAAAATHAAQHATGQADAIAPADIGAAASGANSDITSLTGLTGQVDHAGANVTYLPANADLAAAVTAASAGDTLVLASGTYTLSATLEIDKQLCLRGQGAYATTLTYAGTLLEITADTVIVEDLSLTNTGTGPAILYDGAIGGRLLSARISNSGAGDRGAVRYLNAGGVVWQVSATAASTDGAGYGVQMDGSDAATRSTTVEVLDSQINASGATTGYGLEAKRTSGATYSHTLTARRSSVAASGAGTSYGAYCSGASVSVNVSQTTVSGSTKDLKRTNGTLGVNGAALANGTSEGTITWAGKHSGSGYLSSDGTAGATADVAVAKVGGGTRTLHFKDGLYTGYTDT